MPNTTLRRNLRQADLFAAIFRTGVRPFAQALAGATAAVLACAALAQTPTVAATPPLKFEIGAYRVTGDTLLGESEIQALVAPFTGKGMDFGDIQKALKAIREAYAKSGYRGVAVALPEQELGAGIVNIVVTENAIEKLEVSGNGHFGSEAVRALFPMLEEGKAVDFDRLGRALDVVNENPALKTVVEIAPGSREAVRLARIVVTDESPLNWFASLDNSGTDATGKHRLGLGVRHADVGGLGHIVTAQYSVSVEKSSAVSFWGLGYRLPLPARGLSLDVYGGHSDVSSGTVAGLFDVAGKGTVAGARATWQLDRSGGYRHRFAAGIDYREFNNKVVPVGGNQSLVPDYTVHPLNFSYAGDHGPTSFSISLLRGFTGGANTDSATLGQARIGADANYSLLRFAADSALPLAAGWLGRLAISGQQTGDPLVPGEQFGLGGAQSVRGFDERYLAGDSGGRAAFEIHTPLGQFGSAQVKGLAFIDYGELRRNEVLPGELAAESMSSWGLGTRLLLAKQLSLSLDVARVLHGPAGQTAGSGRVHLSLQASF
ncbi:MAG: ShlB/FhaC/HecB family hemolysin secretion/activation protein [Sulfuritalea sp.]|nr:ShlB/FhaC/HecB family hemolysin secretion/activation protein [Sulfuritalea sp.]MDP1982570.1 ShlB/FhaC/HecB family hemolysin secretion/activation protein [Sulfuritalea sp.]